jgi:hypothetical protein
MVFQINNQIRRFCSAGKVDYQHPRIASSAFDKQSVDVVRHNSEARNEVTYTSAWLVQRKSGNKLQ